MSAPSKKRMRLDKEQARIVIVGGGLAGLSAAVALEKAGFTKISLFERDVSFDQQKEGYGLTLTYNPKGPLASLGILEKVAQHDCPSRSHYVFRPDGSILGYFGNAFSTHRGIGQRGNLRIPRKLLRRILMEQLQSTTIYWGYRLVGYSFDAETSNYRIQFSERMAGHDTSMPGPTTSGSTTKMVLADLLVAADGIRSAILTKVYRSLYPSSPTNVVSDEDNEVPNADQKELPFVPHEVGLRCMGVRLILGIAEFSHPLLKERGFYTLDGKHRLFTMPYSSNRFAKKESNRIMWQLSYATDEETRSRPLNAVSLRDYVVETCSSWHDPVLAMVQATPIDKIWGTDLMDRDPIQVQKMIEHGRIRRLVVVGDALHSMSPFKGQGANQALADGPLLAHWLQKASIDSAVTSFWRETVQRTAPVVAASRKAAMELHSPLALRVENHGFAGVQEEAVPRFLELLRQRKVDTSRGALLDSHIQSLIQELGIAAPEPFMEISALEQKKALQYASCGDTQSLRIQSIAKHSESIQSARDDHGRTCLHLAALGGHSATCAWLLTELDCDPLCKDASQKTAMDYAVEPEVVSIFQACLGSDTELE